MGVQKMVKRHLRKKPKSRKQVMVRGHLRIKRTDIKKKGKGR
jgi:hypothetical protein